MCTPRCCVVSVEIAEAIQEPVLDKDADGDDDILFAIDIALNHAVVELNREIDIKKNKMYELQVVQLFKQVLPMVFDGTTGTFRPPNDQERHEGEWKGVSVTITPRNHFIAEAAMQALNTMIDDSRVSPLPLYTTDDPPIIPGLAVIQYSHSSINVPLREGYTIHDVGNCLQRFPNVNVVVNTKHTDHM